MATENLRVGIDATGAKAGGKAVVRSLKDIKNEARKTGESFDKTSRKAKGIGAGVAATTKPAIRSMREIRAITRSAGRSFDQASKKAGTIGAGVAAGARPAIRSMREIKEITRGASENLERLRTKGAAAGSAIAAGTRPAIRSMAEIKAITKSTGRSIDVLKAKSAGVGSGVTAGANLAVKGLTRLKAAAISTTQSVTLLGSRLASLAAAGVARAFSAASTAAAGLGAKISGVAKKTREAGSALRIFGLALAAAFALAIKSSSDFELTMSRITGLVGIAADEVKGFEKPLLAIAKATAKGPNELAEAMFFITSAGARGSKAIRILEASARAAAAGLGETKVVADAVTSAVNAYGEENLSAAKSTDILVATVREGKAAAEEIAGAIGPVLPIATQLGVTFDQVGATIAALTRVGLNASESQVALKATLNALSKPGKEAVDTLEELSQQNLGVALSFDDVRKVLREDGLIAALQLLQDATGGNTQQLQKIFPNIRAGAGVFSLLGKNAAQVEQIFRRMTDTTDAGNKAFSAFADTTAFKVGQAIVDIKIAFKDIADNLLPATARAFTALADSVERTIGFFKGLGEAIAEAVGGSDDPLTRLMNQQREVQDGLDAFNDPTNIKTLQAFANESLGINFAGQELTGTYEQQIKQLETLKIRIAGQIAEYDKATARVQEQNRKLRDQEDILEEIVVTVERLEKPKVLIDSDALEDGKEALADLIRDVETFGRGLAGVQVSGTEGLNLAADAAEANQIFKNLQGQVKLTEQEILDLVVAKRTLEEQINKVTEAFDKQKSAVQTVETIRTNIANLQEQLSVISGEGGLDAFFATTAAQEAALIIADMGENANITITELTALIETQRLLNEQISDTKSQLDGSKEKFDIFKEFGIQAARNIQTAFADFLFDPFSEGLDGMVFKFAESIKKIASEILANQILTSFFKSLSGFGGGIGSFADAAIGSLGGNQFGGDVQKGTPSLVNEQGSAKGEIFVPGQDGRVLTKQQASQAAAPNVEVPVSITNVTDPADTVSVLESSAGSKAIMNVISTNPATIKRLLA
jgi:TP901 family phage tail tape measure protein